MHYPLARDHQPFTHDRMRFAFVPLALLLALLTSIPANAEPDVSTIPEQSSHAALVDTIQANADMDAIMAKVLAETDRQLRFEPSVANLEAQNPGIITQMVEGMAPTLRLYQDRIRQQYKPDMIAAAHEVFTAEEAQELTNFYGSEVGQRFLKLLSRNFSVSNMLEGAIDQKFEVTADEIRRDNAVTVSQTLGALSADDIREIEAMLNGSAAIAKMPLFSERALAVQLLIENEPPSPSEQRALEQVVSRIMTDRLK